MGRCSPFFLLLSCWSCRPCCWHREKDRSGNLAAVPAVPVTPSTGAQDGKRHRSRLFPGSAFQTSNDAWVPGYGLQAHPGVCPPSLLLRPLLRVAQRPSFVPSRTFSEGLHILMGYSHPMLQTLSRHKGKEQPSSPHHPPPQSHAVTKETLIPSSGEGDSVCLPMPHRTCLPAKAT